MNTFETIDHLLNGRKKTESEETRDSREALLSSLTNDQETQLLAVSSLWITAKGGKRYCVQLNGGIIREERSKQRWYLRIRGVNIWDELAIKKGWLEQVPEEILGAAKKIELETSDVPDIPFERSDPYVQAFNSRADRISIANNTFTTTSSNTTDHPQEQMRKWSASNSRRDIRSGGAIMDYIRRVLEDRFQMPAKVDLVELPDYNVIDVHAEVGGRIVIHRIDKRQFQQYHQPELFLRDVAESLYDFLRDKLKKKPHTSWEQKYLRIIDPVKNKLTGKK